MKAPRTRPIEDAARALRVIERIAARPHVQDVIIVRQARRSWLARYTVKHDGCVTEARSALAKRGVHSVTLGEWAHEMEAAALRLSSQQWGRTMVEAVERLRDDAALTVLATMRNPTDDALQ